MKRILVSFASVCLFLATPAHAILDENGNGMSDVWEKQSNAGKLLTWDFLPWGDADADGMSNEMESIAGTNPFSQTDSGGLFRVSVGHTPAGDTNPETIDVTHPTALGKNYRLISSPDLKNWTPLDAAYLPGTGLETTWHFPIAGNPRYFFKPEISDEDPDGDGLTTAEELFLGTDPTNAFTHGGTTNDHDVQTAVATQTLVTAPDPAADADEDGIPDSLDAMPDNDKIDWLNAPDDHYVSIDLQSVTATDGDPMSLSPGGLVVFKKSVWSTGNWIFPTFNGSVEKTILTKNGENFELEDAALSFHGGSPAAFLGADQAGNLYGCTGESEWAFYGVGVWWKNTGTPTTPAYGELLPILPNSSWKVDYCEDFMLMPSYVSSGGTLALNLRLPITGPAFSFGRFLADPTPDGASMVFSNITPDSHPDNGPLIDRNNRSWIQWSSSNDNPVLHLTSTAGDGVTSTEMTYENINIPHAQGPHVYLPTKSYGGRPLKLVKLANGTAAGSSPGAFVRDPSKDRLAFSYPAGIILESATHQLIAGPAEGGLPVKGSTARFPTENNDLPFLINARGEAFCGSQIWRNGVVRELSDLLPQGHGYSDLKTIDTNDAGLILSTAAKNGTNKNLLLAPATLRLDANRDGTIDGKDEAAPIAVTPENPWRWWINDDDDVGDLCSSDGDVPGIHGPSNYYNPYTGITNSTPDRNDSHDTVVNHRGDIVDFFPVHLDLKTVLNLLPEGALTVKLKHTGGALNFVYTDLEPSKAGTFLTGEKDGEDNTEEKSCFGPSFDQPVMNAVTERITAAGVELNAAFLKKIRDSGREVTTGNVTTVNPEKGVILLEGRSTTEAPLIVEILKGAEVIGEIKLPLNLSGVEDMYRWANFRATCNEAEARASDLGVPSNYPDELTNGKTLVFLHGYNVPEVRARGWCAEVFKRLHQCGSRAKFVAATWRGDQSTLHLGGVALDYHCNVRNAFATARPLKVMVLHLPGEKHIMAHSLGNMAASAAIKEVKMNVAKYYAIDAAVAMEAYDNDLAEDPAMLPLMRDPSWDKYVQYISRPDNPSRVWATEWHKLFQDGRKALTWRDCFGNIPNMWNLHSTGEDTLANPLSPGMPFLTPWEFDVSRAWEWQEKVKGLGIAEVAGTVHGGWGINATWEYQPTGDDPPPWKVFEAGDDEIRSNPVFEHFKIPGILGPDGKWPHRLPLIYRAQLLGEAIPALSFATGRNALPKFNEDPFNPRNQDMMSLRITKAGVEREIDGQPNPAAFQWPRVDPQGGKPWQHCDFRNVAFYYTQNFYRKIVALGEFNQ